MFKQNLEANEKLLQATKEDLRVTKNTVFIRDGEIGRLQATIASTQQELRVVEEELDNVSTQAATDTADMKKRYIAGLDGFEREFKRMKSMW